MPQFLERLRERRRVLGGTPLSDPRPGAKAPATPLFLTAATELTDDAQIRRFRPRRACGLRRPGGWGMTFRQARSDEPLLWEIRPPAESPAAPPVIDGVPERMRHGRSACAGRTS